jgi:hypothetical protein
VFGKRSKEDEQTAQLPSYGDHRNKELTIFCGWVMFNLAYGRPYLQQHKASLVERRGFMPLTNAYIIYKGEIRAIASEGLSASCCEKTRIEAMWISPCQGLKALYDLPVDYPHIFVRLGSEHNVSSSWVN